MRCKLIIGLLAGLLASDVACAQSFPMEMTIIVPEAEVRSGPSATMYPTNKLRQGERVMVIGECREQPGWLEIQPPAGSFSWIDAKHVKQVNNVAVVEIDSAPILVGSSLINKKPDVEKKPGFSKGYIVTLVDKPQATDGTTYLPIQPHPLEVRYLPAEAVRAAQVASNSPANWTQPGTKSATLPGYPAAQTTGSQGTRPTLGSTTAFSPTPPGTTQPLTTAARWSNYGILRSTQLPLKDGQPIYMLVDGREQTLAYVTTRPGTSLRSYVGRTISLFGPIVFENDQYFRRQFLVATHIAEPNP